MSRCVTSDGCLEELILKYAMTRKRIYHGVLFLLQEPEGEGVGGVPLDKYVFNTEAHPMSIWDDSKSNFGK